MLGSQPMNLGGTKTSPLIMQREPSCQKCSPQIPCVVTNCTSGYRKGEKNQMLVKCLPCFPLPLFGQGLAPELEPQSFLPNISKRLNPMSSTSSRSPLPRRRPRGSGPTPAPNLVAAPLPDSTQTPKGLQPLTTDVRKAQPGPRGAAPAPQRPPLLRAKACPERDGSAPLGCRSGLAEGRGRKNQRCQLPSRSTAAARWAPAVLKDGQCQGEGRRSVGKAGLAARQRCGSGAAASSRGLAPTRRRRGLTHDPSPHPVSTPAYPRPFSRARNAALGVARVAALSGGDRRRRVTMTTRGAARPRLRLQESLT